MPRHLNFFTAKSLDALFSGSGLVPRETLYRGYSGQFLPSWMAAQKKIASIVGVARPAASGRLAYWWYLLMTALASQARKYDSVRIVAATK